MVGWKLKDVTSEDLLTYWKGATVAGMSTAELWYGTADPLGIWEKAKLFSWQANSNSSKAFRLHRIIVQNPITPIGTIQLPLGGNTESAKMLNLLLGEHFSGHVSKDYLTCTQSTLVENSRPREKQENLACA